MKAEPRKLGSREQLDPVAPRISAVEAADAREGLVPFDALLRGFEPVRELVELDGGKAEGRMRLTRGREGLLDADVELPAAVESEPDAASRAQRLRLLELLQTEQFAEVTARLGLAAGRRCDLDVV